MKRYEIGFFGLWTINCWLLLLRTEDFLMNAYFFNFHGLFTTFLMNLYSSLIFIS